MFTWVRNMRVFNKILVLAVVLCSLILGLGIYSIRGMAILNDGTKDIHDNQLAPVVTLAGVRYNIMFSSLEVANHIDSTDAKVMQKIEADLQQALQATDQLLAKYRATNMSQEERDILPSLDAALAEYRTVRERVLELSRAGKRDEANLANADALAIRERMQDAIGALVDLNQQLAEKNYVRGQAAYQASYGMFFAILAGAVVAGLMVSYLIAQLISRPLKLLDQAAGQVAKGDLTVQWQISSTDEIGSLAASLQQMITSLREVVQGVQDTAHQMASSAQQLSAATEENGQAITQVTLISQELASEAESQNSGVQSTMAAIQQASAAIEQISATAQQVASAALATSSLAQDGGKSMTQATDGMEKISHSTQQVARIVTELTDRSKAIGQIVALISGIAEQTNLLALNAAIEAARAGEQGRGFTVVAEEVRKLAEQSQSSTKEITALITQIQHDTSRAAEAMQANERLVEDGNQAMQVGAAAFDRIGQAVNDVAQQIAEVSRSTDELAQSSEHMVNTIQEIEKVTQDVAASSQTLASTTEEQTASVEEIASSASALAQMGERLQKAVAHFQLS